LAAGVFLLAAGPAHAITVSGFNPNSTSFLGTSDSFGDSYSGVAELLIVRSDLGNGAVEGCSGSLLADGVSILTSAQCIADSTGAQRATTAYVTFTTADGSYSTQVFNFQVDPAYNGSAGSTSDVAILTLASPAPDTVERYSLYTGDPSDQVITLAGYGIGGTGINGYDPINYPPGTLRVGENQYLPDDGTDALTFAFTNPEAAEDGSDSYTGPNEAFIAPGDGGGPSFIDGEIAGVHSYVTLPGDSNADLGSVLNSSFGEVAIDASVAENLTFIESAMVSTPEPRLMILLLGVRSRESGVGS
jgi:hypothetical protein